MKKAKIVGVSYGGGHANIIIPVIKELSRRGHETLFLGLTTAGPQAEKSGLNHKAYRHYAHLIDKRRAFDIGKDLAKEMHNPNIGLPLEESIFYLGINLLESIETFGKDLSNEIIRKSGRQALLPVDFMKKILQEENADIVIATNSPRSEKASLLAAQGLGLKTVRIEDLYGTPLLHDTFMRRLGSDLYKRTTGRFKMTPTYSCFLCGYAQRTFIKAQDMWDIQDVTLKNSNVTGQPIFDEIDKVMVLPPKFDLFNNVEQRPTVTWVLESGHADDSQVLELIAQWYKKFGSNYNFIIKLRPSFETAECQRIREHFIKNDHLRFIQSEVDANHVIWNSHVLIGQESTMLTQAAYMGHPILVLDPENIRSSAPLVETQVAAVAGNLDDIEKSIQGLLDPLSHYSNRFTKGLKQMAYMKNGTFNISNVVEGLIK